MKSGDISAKRGDWFWMWIYTNICRIAARKEQAALWVATERCIVCHAAMMRGKPFCGDCGAYQEPRREEMNTEPVFTLQHEGVIHPVRLNGKHPFLAYADKLRQIQSGQ